MVSEKNHLAPPIHPSIHPSIHPLHTNGSCQRGLRDERRGTRECLVRLGWVFYCLDSFGLKSVSGLGQNGRVVEKLKRCQAQHGRDPKRLIEKRRDLRG